MPLVLIADEVIIIMCEKMNARRRREFRSFSVSIDNQISYYKKGIDLRQSNIYSLPSTIGFELNHSILSVSRCSPSTLPKDGSLTCIPAFALAFGFPFYTILNALSVEDD